MTDIPGYLKLTCLIADYRIYYRYICLIHKNDGCGENKIQYRSFLFTTGKAGRITYHINKFGFSSLKTKAILS